MPFSTQLKEHLVAGARGFWVHTYEELRAISELRTYCQQSQVLGVQWSVIRGLCLLGEFDADPLLEIGKEEKNPLGAALKWLNIALPMQGHTGPWMLVLPDAHIYIKDIGTRIVKEQILNNKLKGSIVCLSPKRDVPIELERLFTSLPISLPDADELTAHGIPLPGHAENKRVLADAAVGLSLHEAQVATRVAMQQHEKTDIAKLYQSIWDTKSKYLETKGLIKVVIPKETWDDVGGLFNFKRHIEAIAPLMLAPKSKIPPPDGFLLVGFMGTGKSLISRAVAAYLSKLSGRQWKYLEWNTSNLYRPYIGETEAASRELRQLTELHAPCVVRIDEFAHQFSGHGAGGRSDAGVTDRLVGDTMTWFEERPPGIIIMASTNEPDKLPAHIARAGRLSSVWGVSLPGEDATIEILRIYLNRYASELLEQELQPAVDMMVRRKFSGAEIEQAVLESAQLSYPQPPTMERLLKTTERLIPAVITKADEYERITTWIKTKAREA